MNKIIKSEYKRIEMQLAWLGGLPKQVPGWQNRRPQRQRKPSEFHIVY